MFNLVVVGLNSSRYDMPCILEHLLNVCDLDKINIIKKGSAIFSLSYETLLFCDISNYFPGSLSAFCKSMGVIEPKGKWPYEHYRSISQIKNAREYPPISAFFTSLSQIDKSNFWTQLEELFTEFENFGSFMSFLGLKCFPEKADCIDFPTFTAEQKTSLLNMVHISPKDYKIEKNLFIEKIEKGQFSSMACLLSEYNINDTRILHQAIEIFNSNMFEAFSIPIFSKLSLPALSESIMWNNFNSELGSVFSFSRNYGFLNEKVRQGLLGGPGKVQI